MTEASDLAKIQAGRGVGSGALLGSSRLVLAGLCMALTLRRNNATLSIENPATAKPWRDDIKGAIVLSVGRPNHPQSITASNEADGNSGPGKCGALPVCIVLAPPQRSISRDIEERTGRPERRTGQR